MPTPRGSSLTLGSTPHPQSSSGQQPLLIGQSHIKIELPKMINISVGELMGNHQVAGEPQSLMATPNKACPVTHRGQSLAWAGGGPDSMAGDQVRTQAEVTPHLLPRAPWGTREQEQHLSWP